VAVVGAAVVLPAALPATGVGKSAFLAGYVAVVVAAWLAVRRSSGQGRLPFALVAAGLTAWLAGDVTMEAQKLIEASPPVGLPEVFWLAAYPLVGAGLVVMVRRRAPGRSGAGALDGLTLAVAAALCLARFVVLPGLAGSPDATEVVVDALFNLGDLILLASVLYLVLSPGARGPATRLLVGGMVLNLLCDLAITRLPGYLSDADVERLDGLLVLAYALVVAALSHRDSSELLTPRPDPAPTLHPARVLFLGLAMLTAPLMAITRGAIPVAEQVLLAASSTVIVSLILVRFTGAVREQARVQRLLADLAAHDSLTGLANRRTLVDRLTRDFRPVADTMLLYLDLDGFKAVNDRYGHAAGDAVLVEVARRLREAVRAGDTVARLGGDEFAVLCYRLAAADADRLAGRLVDVIERPIRYGAADLTVSASVGFASAGHCPSGDVLITRADETMFAVKRSRRAAAPARPEPAAARPGPVGPATAPALTG